MRNAMEISQAQDTRGRFTYSSVERTRLAQSFPVPWTAYHKPSRSSNTIRTLRFGGATITLQQREIIIDALICRWELRVVADFKYVRPSFRLLGTMGKQTKVALPAHTAVSIAFCQVEIDRMKHDLQGALSFFRFLIEGKTVEDKAFHYKWNLRNTHIFFKWYLKLANVNTPTIVTKLSH